MCHMYNFVLFHETCLSSSELTFPGGVLNVSYASKLKWVWGCRIALGFWSPGRSFSRTFFVLLCFIYAALMFVQ